LAIIVGCFFISPSVTVVPVDGVEKLVTVISSGEKEKVGLQEKFAFDFFVGVVRRC
jgi:hypothetical protein